jgi:DNA repair protein RecO (recombination protein O)
MSTSRRVQGEPAWLLHHRPFRDTSRIIDVLSRDFGRLTLVARGSRSAKSRLKGLLRPFMPLQLSWVIRGDMGTLTGAEMNGTPISLNGDALMAGYYLSELVLNLLHRHDPQPEIHAVYGAAITALNRADDVAVVLRRFEMETLGLLGYALSLDHDALSGDELRPERAYEYRVEQGPVVCEVREGPMIYTGRELQAIARQDFADPATLASAGRLLRNVIAWHLGGRELQSRKVLRDMRRVAEQRTD